MKIQYIYWSIDLFDRQTIYTVLLLIHSQVSPLLASLEVTLSGRPVPGHRWRLFPKPFRKEASRDLSKQHQHGGQVEHHDDQQSHPSPGLGTCTWVDENWRGSQQCWMIKKINFAKWKRGHLRMNIYIYIILLVGIFYQKTSKCYFMLFPLVWNFWSLQQGFFSNRNSVVIGVAGTDIHISIYKKLAFYV